jgi:hypothetical protein
VPAACRQEGRVRRFTVIHGASGSALSCAAAGPPVAATTFASKGSPVQVQRESTATSPASRQLAQLPAHQPGWDNGHTPSSAASSRRRGSCPPRARWGGRERGTTATRGQHRRHRGLA